MQFDPAIKDFFSMWIAPRQTIRRVLARKQIHTAWIIILTFAALGLAGGMLSQLPVLDNSGWTFLAGLVVAMVLFVGIVATIFFLTTWMTQVVGQMMVGMASFSEVLIASAWSLVPLMTFNFIKIILLLPVQKYLPLFTQTSGPFPLWVDIIRYVIIGGGLFCWSWGLVIFSRALAQTQGFKNSWNGFWNVVLPWFFLGLIVFGIMFLSILIGSGMHHTAAAGAVS